jgi:hydrogenase expression/formation protein HypE
VTGKLTPDVLERLVFARTGAPNPDVEVGPAFGQDAAAVRDGDRTLVASADPISLAAGHIGRLGVAVATNDVAACGGVPEYLLVTILLPEQDPDLLDTITADVDQETRRIGVTVVGGHTESVAGLERPLLSLACWGFADPYVPTDGATPGDRLLLTKGAGVEATAVLATDFRDELGLDPAVCDRAADYFDDVSVVPEGVGLAPYATAMHDPTEGGVLEGVIEMALTADHTVVLDRDAVPVRSETRALCDAAGVDPLRVLGSGGLLATVPPEDEDEALAAARSAGVEAAVVGHVTEGPGEVRLDGERLAEPIRDEMYALWD